MIWELLHEKSCFLSSLLSNPNPASETNGKFLRTPDFAKPNANENPHFTRHAPA